MENFPCSLIGRVNSKNGHATTINLQFQCSPQQNCNTMCHILKQQSSDYYENTYTYIFTHTPQKNQV